MQVRFVSAVNGTILKWVAPYDLDIVQFTSNAANVSVSSEPDSTAASESAPTTTEILEGFLIYGSDSFLPSMKIPVSRDSEIFVRLDTGMVHLYFEPRISAE